MKRSKLLIFTLIIISLVILSGSALAMKQLRAIDAFGSTLMGINYSSSVYANVLAANVAESVTIPTGAKYVLFSGTANFYVKFNGTAAVPADEVADGTASILNPGLRSLDGATTIGLIAGEACIVTMEFY